MGNGWGRKKAVTTLPMLVVGSKGVEVDAGGLCPCLAVPMQRACLPIYRFLQPIGAKGMLTPPYGATAAAAPGILS